MLLGGSVGNSIRGEDHCTRHVFHHNPIRDIGYSFGTNDLVNSAMWGVIYKVPYATGESNIQQGTHPPRGCISVANFLCSHGVPLYTSTKRMPGGQATRCVLFFGLNKISRAIRSLYLNKKKRFQICEPLFSVLYLNHTFPALEYLALRAVLFRNRKNSIVRLPSAQLWMTKPPHLKPITNRKIVLTTPPP